MIIKKENHTLPECFSRTFMLHWLFAPNNYVSDHLSECNTLVRKWPALREYLYLYLLYIYILFNKYNIRGMILFDFLFVA